MKKQNILNLIKYHTEGNDDAFRTEALEIASHFDKTGDYQLAEYVMSLLSMTNTLVPQLNNHAFKFMKQVDVSMDPLPLPDVIKEDVFGVINAIGHDVGVSKFLFEGLPGTGKTATAHQIARILDRKLFVVDFDTVIDSKLGQTSKNIALMFEEIQYIPNPHKIIILFDEIDAIALNRINAQDLREMGRATTSILKGLDSLSERIVLIASTNLFKSFDKALVRRFDSVINFNRYTKKDLELVGESLLNFYLSKFKFAARNINLFRKIINTMDPLLYPGELKNLIKTSLAFSSPDNEFDYLKRLFLSVNANNKNCDIKYMQNLGFTVREIEILSGVSKSQVSRRLHKN